MGIKDVIDMIRERTEIQEILDRHQLSRILLRAIIIEAKKGKIAKEICQTLGIHAITLKRYVQEYGKMTESEVEKLSPIFQESELSVGSKPADNDKENSGQA